MKIRLFCTVMFVLVGFSGCGLVAPQWVFPFQSARIEYKISGDVDGKEVLFIDGENEAREAVVVTGALGEKIVTQSRIVTVGEDVYLESSVGENKIEENIHYQKMKEMGAEERKAYYLENVILSGTEAEKVGVELVLGRECDLYKVSFGTLCVWENVVLKKEIKMMESETIMEAEKIELDAVMPRNTFEFEVL